MNLACIIFSLLVGITLCQPASKPHILMILSDDYGWANVGYHRNPPTREVQTPNIDGLVNDGIELNRHYAFMYCSPSRSALQTGRNPIHVNVLNLSPNFHNPADPVSGFAAIPRNMTGIATKLKQAGYSTHMVGKWDAGMATLDHIPTGRGYDTSLNYFHHANDYWNQRTGECGETPIVDLWDTDRPAFNATDPSSCAQDAQDGCVYEDLLFEGRVLEIIQRHNASTPLFLFWAPHNVHEPLQVPDAFLAKFNFINVPARHFYHSMVSFMDAAIGNVISALKDKGLYDNTLVVFSSDNGGPIYLNGSAGANNYPLRGGKVSNWEGGVRVNAFVSGGFLPPNVRGTKQEGLVTLWDWYATFSSLAGVDPRDDRAARAGLPPIDSFNMWPLLSGQTTTSPRTEVPLGAVGAGKATLLGGIIMGDYKLLVEDVAQAGWTGPQFPNVSTNWISSDTIAHCGAGCLFNVKDDPTEHVDIADQNPDIVAKLQARMNEIKRNLFSPDRGKADPVACTIARGLYKGYWGPFVP